MLKSRLLIVFVTLVLFDALIPMQVYAQNPSRMDCLIVSFHRTRLKETRVFYWVIPNPSKDCKSAFPLSLITDEKYDDKYYYVSKDFTDSAFLRRINYPSGEGIPMFNGSMFADINGISIEDYNYIKQPVLKTFISLVNNHKKEIQRVSKTWSEHHFHDEVEDLSRKPETIIIYITPVSGIFEKGWKWCISSSNSDDDWFKYESNYACYSYRPVGEFLYDDSFWKTNNAQIIKYLDFSFFHFWEYSTQNFHNSDNLGLSIIE